MANNILRNWKTTLIGLITGGTISLDALVNQGIQNGWKQALFGLAIAVLGALVKDADKTGVVTKKVNDNTTDTGLVGGRPDDRQP